jgi:subtilisin family serine protease
MSLNCRIAVAVLLLPVLIPFLVGESFADEYIADQLVCRVAETYGIDSINGEYGTEVVDYSPELSSYLLSTPDSSNVDSLANVISLQSYVIYCHPNYVLNVPEAIQSSQPFSDLTGSGSFGDQQATIDINLSDGHAISAGTGATVAVLDVGTDYSHPAFDGATLSGEDYIDGDSTSTDEPGGRASGHGTFVAGIVNLVAPAAEIRSYRVLDTTGQGDGYTVATAIVRAVFDSCNVINLSMAMPYYHGVIEDALQYAHSHGVTVVAATGNDSSETALYPAGSGYTIAVTAVDSVLQVADFANVGSYVDLSAPGTQIYAPYLDHLFAWWDGTSFAAPFVTGQVALLYAALGQVSPDSIKTVLTTSAIDITSLNPGYENKLGSGIPDIAGSLLSSIQYICGDVNNDRVGPDIADLTALVDYLYVSLTPPANLLAANIDGGTLGQIDIGDLTHLVTYLYLGGPAPVCTQ